MDTQSSKLDQRKKQRGKTVTIIVRSLLTGVVVSPIGWCFGVALLGTYTDMQRWLLLAWFTIAITVIVSVVVAWRVREGQVHLDTFIGAILGAIVSGVISFLMPYLLLMIGVPLAQ